MTTKTITVAALILSLGLFANCKDELTLERSIVIDAPVETIFNNVNNLKESAKWSPWMAEDPTMKTTYNDIAAGVGASSSWTSEDSGEGSQTITASEPYKSITTKLDFKDQGTAEAYWNFEKTDEGVKTTWSFKSVPNGIGDQIFGLMMDSILGPQFEAGLAKLKEVSEAGQ